MEDSEVFQKAACKTVAKSIGEMLRFSLDEEFRKETFTLLNVKSTKQVEWEIEKRLLDIMEKEVEDGDTRLTSKKSEQIKGNDNSSNEESVQVITPSNLAIAYETDKKEPQTTTQKRSWLKISSDKFKKTVTLLQSKRSCYSLESHEINTQTSNCSTYFELYKTTSRDVLHSFSFGVSTLNKRQYSSSQVMPSVETLSLNNYYRSKFKESLRSGNNYLANNVKMFKSCYF